MRYAAQALALIALATALLAPSGLVAQTSAPIIRAVGIDTQQFPALTLRLNYTTGRGEPVAEEPDFAVSVDGAPVASPTVRRERHEVAVALVADLSAHMSDQGTGFSRRFDDMLPRMKELVDQLREGGHFASLVTFTDQVRTFHELTYDLGAVSNTLNRGDPQRLFEPVPIERAAPGGPYPLAEAIDAGLDQLAAADPAAPLALVLFATGDPAPQDLAAVRARLDEQRAAGRPVQLLIVGFGSGEPGAFTTFPAGLADVAATLDARLIEVGVQPLAEQTRREIDAAFGAIGALADQYAITFDASAIPAGGGTVTVTAGEASDSISFNPGEIPPRFHVVVDTRAFQGQARLAIAVEFQQAPLSRVEYLLNDVPLATSEQAPDFAQTISVYDPVFQQRFPPGEYQLTAAAFDANGNQSRSQEPVPITIFAPPPVSPLEQVARFWWLGLIIAALLGLAAYGFLRRPAGPRARPISKTAPTSLAPGEEPTVEHGATTGYSATQAHQPQGVTTEFHAPGGLTTEFQPRSAKTQRLRTTWVVEVIEGEADKGRRFEMSEERYFTIGRANPPEPPPEFALASTLVSKGSHARLSLLHDGVELTAGASRNGTYIGDDQREIQPQSRHILKENDVFWLSRGVKLRVRQEDAP